VWGFLEKLWLTFGLINQTKPRGHSPKWGFRRSEKLKGFGLEGFFTFNPPFFLGDKTFRFFWIIFSCVPRIERKRTLFSFSKRIEPLDIKKKLQSQKQLIQGDRST
jgi:hypothetical protein